MTRIKKTIPKYDSKTITAKVVLDAVTGKKRLAMTHPDYYQHEINEYAVGDNIFIRLTNKKRKRTEAQNRYMHLYFTLIAKSSGHNTDEIKQWAKGKFLSKGITEVFGDKTRKVQDTSKLTVSEMIEFIARVEVSTGIPAPDPEPFNMPVTYDEYKAMKKKQEAHYATLNPKLK